MELSKRDTKMLQGLSVLAMVCLHLFDTTSYKGLFQPLVFIKGIPLSFYFGQISDFCVFGFAFCSGYAHLKLYEQPNYFKHRLKSLLILMINFWIVLILFTVVSVCTGQSSFMPGNLWKFLGTAFLYDMHYNGAWWYLWAYVLLVLISPLLLKAVKKFPVITIVLGFIIYCIAYFVRFKIITDNYILVRFGPFGMTLFEYLLGCIAYRFRFFSKLRLIWRRCPIWFRWVGACVLLVILLITRTLLIPSLFFAPISGFIIISLFSLWKKPKWVEGVFLFLGKHATNIWLTHMFFYLVLFTNLVYSAKYPILILLLMLMITIPISMVIQLIEKPFIRVFSNSPKERKS